MDDSRKKEYEEKLEQLRKEIDKADNKIAESFVERMKISAKISQYKANAGLPAVDKRREHSIVSRLSTGMNDEMAGYLKVLYGTVFDLSRAHQIQSQIKDSDLSDRIRAFNADTERNEMIFPTRASVACQGADGSYSQITCDRIFKRADIMYCNNYKSVFNAVSTGFCRFGVLPIENSAQGAIKEVYELLKSNDVHIVSAVNMRIRHALLAKSEIEIDKIDEVFTYRHALAECSEYLKSLNEVKISICENTAEAAKMVANSANPNAVAVSSPMCAPIYGLKIIGENIHNTDENFTRFICIENGLKYYNGANKISICVTLQNRAGALYDLLSRFAAMGINITKLESRNINNNDFECEFYIDFEGDLFSTEILNLLVSIENTSDRFYLLGCYTEH